MAKVTSSAFSFIATPNKKRPGVISKCKTSRIKSSKNYKKTYRGQGRL